MEAAAVDKAAAVDRAAVVDREAADMAVTLKVALGAAAADKAAALEAAQMEKVAGAGGDGITRSISICNWAGSR